MFKRYLNNEKGFSMIEMMVVLIIIAVLMAGGIKFYLGYIENSRVTKAKAQISTMQTAWTPIMLKSRIPCRLEASLMQVSIETPVRRWSKDLEQKDPVG